MQLVNIHEAKTRLSKLLERVEAGEDIVIARYGKPVARLSRAEGGLQPRQPGALQGKIWVSEHFDDADEELERLFYGDGG